MFVSSRNPSIFLGGGKLVIVFEMIYLFSTFKVFSMVKRLRQSTAFCFKNFVIDEQISPFWLDNRDVHPAGA